MYDEIRDIPVIAQPFATPRFYADFIYTPGYLIPPDVSGIASAMAPRARVAHR